MGALHDCRAALAGCDWARARELLEAVVTTDPAEEADRLALLADAMWWLGRMEACVQAREQAYNAYVTQGRAREAVQAAVWLFEHHAFLAKPAMAGAWLRRGRRMLDEIPEDERGAEWGHLLLREAEAAHGRGELDGALVGARTALDLGRRLRSLDLEAEALQTIGRLLVDRGDVDEGMGHLDEAMLCALEGRLGPYSSGKVYCSMIGACENLGDIGRAAEWTDATVRWSLQHPFAVFPGLCRVKRADVLRWRGRWEEAEQEARLACSELTSIKIDSAATAWVEVGEIRLRIGDLEGAEDAFGRALALTGAPPPGLAALRLAQGRPDEARAIIDGLVDEQTWNRLARARLLPVQAQIAVACDDLAAATAAVEEAEAIVTAYPAPALRAAALVARGRLQLAQGDTDAVSTLRRAVDSWSELEVPYETATAQLLLSRARHLAGDPEGAARCLEAASATFRRLGAAYDARDAAPPQPVRVELPACLTDREAEVLRLVSGGLTNKDVARELGLSQKTVARHLSNIFVKTGVTSRAGATAFAFENGIVSR